MALFVYRPMTVFAEEAVTAFGSEEYQTEVYGEVFPIGIYIKSEALIGEYHVELRYDNERLRYVEGATSEKDGVLVVDGTGDGEQVKVFLYFEAISGGEASIKFENAKVYTLEEVPTLMDVVELAFAPIMVEGEDTGSISFEEQQEELNVPQVENEQDIMNTVPESVVESSEKSNETPAEEITVGISKYDSASAVYEKSKNVAVQNRKDKMISIFFVFLACVIVIMIIIWILLSVSRRKIIEESENEDVHFPFEFDTVPNQKNGNAEWAKVIHHDLDMKENAGQDVSQVNFKELSANSKVNDIELITIDLNDD